MNKHGFHHNSKQRVIKEGLKSMEEKELKALTAKIERELRDAGKPVPSPKVLRAVAASYRTLTKPKKPQWR